MQDLKISIITVVFNARDTLQRCIESVISQNYTNTEYIVIDGGSTDGSLDLIEKYRANIRVLVSEPDNGIYDAMNKGIKLATGSVIGMVNADDFFVNNSVVSDMAEMFITTCSDIVYADLDFVDGNDKVVRKWRSGNYSPLQFNLGWMPPHLTFYCKKELFFKYGMYSLNYGTAADYELMLRFMHLNKIKAVYLRKIIINMKVGGVSNKSYFNRVKGLYFDLQAMRNNGILLPIITILLKPLRKIGQYL